MLFLISSVGYAAPISFENYSLACSGDDQKCKDIDIMIGKKIKDGLDSNNAKSFFNLLLFDVAISRLSYSSFENGIQINIQYYKKIAEFQITHKTDIDTKILERLVGLNSGSFFKESSLEDAKEQILGYFVERGYLNASINTVIREKDSKVNINLVIDTGSFAKVKDIHLISDSSPESLELIKRRFNKFQNKVWNKIDLKFEIDRLSADLFNDGYFSSSVKSLPAEYLDEENVILKIEVSLEDKNSFSFHGTNVFNHQEVLTKLKEGIKSNLGFFKEDELVNIIIEMYKDIGIFNTDVSVYKNIGTDKRGQSFVNYFFNIKEGKKVVINSLSFVGNVELSIDEIRGVYFDKAPVLIRRGFLDLKYVDDFSTILKNKYLEQGFVQIDISSPRVSFNKTKDRVDVEYRIKEKQQTILEKLNFEGVPLKYRSDIRKLLYNKKNNPLNVLEIDSDIEKTIQFLKAKGFYFAQILKKDSSQVLKYDPSYSKATLNINVQLGDMVIFNDALVSGYSTTKKVVLEREIHYKRGDILTPSNVQALKNRLSSLGLFSSINIRPLKDKSSKNYNLLVQVQEKDFGQAFVAPGFRTDLGYKLSVGTRYNNIGGMNRVGSLRAQVNRRTSYSAFDPRRQQEQKDMLEYYFRGNLTEPYFVPYVFGDRMEGDVGFSVERKRYYEFDADRFRIAPSLSKSFNKIFSASLKYQWERINQYDATSEINNDDFNIGGITPGFSLDFRDDPVKPTIGSFFSLSVEFANPGLGSMNNDSIRVDYYKLVSRNRFYLPYKDFVFAFSGSFGVQQNFSTDLKYNADGTPIYDENGDHATEGYIPSIKVFRLNGIDLVRGYAEDEINILPDGRDIGDVIIRDKAYFVNFKFEARYSVNSSLVVGPFFDAGRVFVNNIDLLDLRSSVGLTMKYVTPVGTLDFDYGIKTHRMSTAGGIEESFGRFHLSIGFF
jgi:outer membrane protein insertion porin family